VIALALDYGERRIGVAISDPQGLTARPLTVITRETREKDLERVRQIAAQFGVTLVVLGLPLNMDGTESPGARQARRFGNTIRHRLELAVELWDERLTTFEADQQMLEAGLSPERRKELRDAVAAAVILQDYLEAQRRAEG
jgi:putative Holliday junction resolvase